MLKEWCIRHKYSAIFIAFLICFYGYSISRVYGFIFFPDEFGYWTYAAKAAGYDWSEIVSLGSYYSYGYSLILFPIFKLCEDSVTAYRVAVTLNFVLLGVVFFILSSMTRKLFGRKNRMRTALFAMIAAFYPSWLFFAKTTMVEIILMTMFVVISALLYDYLEKNKLSTLILLVVALVYIHFLHMRSVGILIAGGVTLLIYFLLQSGKTKQFVIAVGIGAVVLAGGFALKEVMQRVLYASAGQVININDYAGQLEKIYYIFSKEGIVNFICGLAGKILYLGLASFGLAFWGMWYAVKEVWSLCKQIKAHQTPDVKKLFYLFVILSAIGETLINTIYNIRPIRIDSLTYGRYHEFVLPILMLLGLQEVTITKKPIMGTLAVILSQLPMVPMVLYCVERYQLTNFHGYTMVGMSYLHNTENFEPNLFYWLAYAFGILLIGVVTSVIRLSRKRGRKILPVLIIVLEFALSVKTSTNYITDSSLGAYRDVAVVEKIEELQDENRNRRIVYLVEDDSTFISIMQFMMRDQKIEMVTARAKGEAYTEEEMDADDIILLKFDSSYMEEMEDKYSNSLLNGHFIMFYNS